MCALYTTESYKRILICIVNECIDLNKKTIQKILVWHSVFSLNLNLHDMQIFIVNLFAIWAVKIETEKLSFHLVTLLSMQILSLQPQTLKLLRAENRSEGQTERGGYTGCQSLSRGVRTPTGSVWGWRTHGSMKIGGHREWREEGQRRKDKDAATGGQTEHLFFSKKQTLLSLS